jgi:hypothetical protein
MARRRKKDKSRKQQGSVLADVFGIKLEAAGGSESPAPPKVADTTAEDAVEARVAARERAAHMAEIRAAAVDVAKTAGVKQGRAHAFVKLLDLSGVAVDSAGEPDTAEIARLVRAGAEEYPELTTAGGSPYGAAPGGRRIPNG